MATDHKFKVKNGLHTQNIEFVDSNNTHSITASMLTSDTLSFSGGAGQLFSLTDSMSGTIFSVNDVSGIPSIEVDDDGTIRLAETSGNILIGTGTDDGSTKLQVDGSVKVTGFTTSGQLDVGTQNIKIGNNYIYASGDNNSIHVNAVTSFIPDSTTTANNPSLGLTGYRWNGIYGSVINGTSLALSNGWTITEQSAGYAQVSNWTRFEGIGVYTTTAFYVDLDDSSSRFAVRGTSNQELFNINTGNGNKGTFNTSVDVSGVITVTGNNWYQFGPGSMGASIGSYGMGNKNSSSARQLTFHVPNIAAYSNSGTIPSFGWYSNGSVNLMTLESASGDLAAKGTLELQKDETATGDMLSLYGNRLGTTTMYGFGLSNATLYHKAHTRHQFYNGTNYDNSSYDVQIDSNHLQLNDIGLKVTSLEVLDTSRNLKNLGNITANGSSFVFGSGSQVQTQMYLRAQNTSGSPARATAFHFEGYESRSQGLFFRDTGLSNEEWFAGIPYSSQFNRFAIGHHSTTGTKQSEYNANELFSVDTDNNIRLNNVVFLGTSSTYHQIRGRDGNTAIYLGGSGDNRNYYDSAHHRWRTDNGAVNLGEWSQTGLHIGGITTPSEKLEVTGNASIGNASNIAMNGSSDGQLKIKGNGYTGAIALDGTAMHIYHNSNSRDLVLGTNETARLTINGVGSSTFSGALSVNGSLDVHGNITFTSISQNAYVGLVPETDQNLMLGTGSGSEPRIYLKGTGNGQSDAGDLFLAAGSGGTLIFQTAPTSVGTMTIQNSSPVLILDDNNATNNTNQTGYISYKRNGVENGYVGYGSSGTDLFYVAGVADVTIRAGGVNQLTASSTGVTITGDLTVNGTTTTIDTTNLNVEDNNITLNYSTGDSSASANGAGITIQDAVNSTTDAFMNWNATHDIFQFSHSATFGYTTIDPDLFLGTSGGFGNIADGGGWSARGLYIHGGATGDAAAIGHNGAALYFGIQNNSTANSMATWLTVQPNKSTNFAAQLSVTGHGNSSQWNTAYGWGDHGSAGYITSVTAGAGLTGGGSSDAVTLAMNWLTSDSFTGTYSLVWNASNDPYTASWLQVRGSDDTLLTRNIYSNGYIKIDNGTGSAPSLRFNVDENTGLFRQYEGVVSFTSDGTNVLDVGKYLKQPLGYSFQFPANTQGWRKLAKIDSRGGGRLIISFTGGNFAPTTFVIDYFKDWSSTCNLKLEQYGSSAYITKARLRHDSSDSKTYLEIYLNNTSSNTENSVQVFDQRLLGYNATTTVYTGALSAGSSSGTTRIEMDFLPQGSTFNKLNVKDATTLDSTLTVSGQSTLARPVLVNGANDNSGRADFAVDAGSSPQISLHGNQVQIGSTDMNWNAKFFHDSSGGHVAVWDNNLEFFSQGSNTGSATGRDIIFSPQVSGTAASTERMRIKGATGRVGIGVTNPQLLLHLNGGSTRTDVQVTLDGYGEGAADGAQFGIQTQGAYIWNYENTDLYFATNNTRRLTIDEDGQVGIGTASPSAVLSLIDPDLTTAGQGLAGLRVHRPNAASQYGYVDYDYGGGGINIGSLYSGGGSSVYGTIHFKQHNAAGSQTAMFIGNTGNVGIGTINPQNPLEILTSNKLGASFTGGTDGEGIRITQSNYTAGNNISLIEASYDDSSSTPDARIGVMFNSSGSTLKFGTSNNYGTGITNTAMVITPLGTVGINQTSPNEGSKLHVGGSVRISSAASDQNTSADTGAIPGASGADVLRLEGTYTNGQYTTEFAKIDRSGNLPLYIRESRSTANSFTNIMRIGGHGRADGTYTAEVFGALKVAGDLFSTSTVKANYFISSLADSTPAGTTFANAFKGGTRVAYFDGDATVSTWYGSENTAYAAIDATNGVLKLYVNDTGGNWHQKIGMTSSGVTHYGTVTSTGVLNKIDSGSYATFEADGNTNEWKWLRLSTNGTTAWDIAARNNDLSNALQFRPGGGATNRTYMDTSGNWVFNGKLTNTDTSESQKVVLNFDTGGNMILGHDGSYGITGNGRYMTLGFGGTTNGLNRIFAHNGTAAGMYFAAATGQGFNWRVSGSGNNSMILTAAGYLGIGTNASPHKILDVVVPNNNFVSFANTISPNNWTGIHFGYRENNNSYRKSAIVFERTDLTEGNAQGKVHILNGPQSGSGNCTLSDAALTIRENGAVVLPKSVLEFENGSNTITASMLSSDTLSFSGDSGQLFSLTDSMSGTIFSVNDVSGIPSIEVEDDGTVYLAETTGNVLIGTGTDDGSTKLQVNGSIKVEDGTLSLPSYSFISDPDSGMTSIASNAIGFITGGAQRFKINSNGLLLTGTSSLYINGQETITSGRIVQNVSLQGTNTGSRFKTGQYFYDTANIARFQFVNNGNVSHSKWRTGGSGGKHIFENGSGTERAEIDANGNFIVDGNITAYGSASDINVKENIEVIPNAVQKVQKLDGVTFNYKKDGSRSTGLIAQQLQEVLPEVVYETTDLEGTDHLAVRYGNVVGLLVEAIKEQQTQLTAQQEQINELTNLVNKLMEK